MFYTIVDTLKLGDFSIKVPRTDAAFGGWCEACGAKLASLALDKSNTLFNSSLSTENVGPLLKFLVLESSLNFFIGRGIVSWAGSILLAVSPDGN